MRTEETAVRSLSGMSSKMGGHRGGLREPTPTDQTGKGLFACFSSNFFLKNDENVFQNSHTYRCEFARERSGWPPVRSSCSRFGIWKWKIEMEFLK